MFRLVASCSLVVCILHCTALPILSLALTGVASLETSCGFPIIALCTSEVFVGAAVGAAVMFESG